MLAKHDRKTNIKNSNRNNKEQNTPYFCSTFTHKITYDSAVILAFTFLFSCLRSIKLKFSTVFIFITLCFISLKSHSGTVSLGSAERYIIAVGSTNAANGSLLLGSEANIWGNVAAANYLSLSSGVKIRGDACSLFVAQGAGSSIEGDKNIAGDCANLNQLGQDIATASKQAREQSNQYMFGDIESTQTLSASKNSTYAVNNLNLQTGEYLTIKGNANNNIIVNVTGLASIGSGAGILLQGGILAKNVIFNFLDNASMSNFIFGGADISGTFLSNSRSFQLGDGAILNDSRFYTNASIQANVQTVKFGQQSNAVAQVPEPSTFLLMLLAISFLWFSNKKGMKS